MSVAFPRGFQEQHPFYQFARCFLGVAYFRNGFILYNYCIGHVTYWCGHVSDAMLLLFCCDNNYVCVCAPTCVQSMSDNNNYHSRLWSLACFDTVPRDWGKTGSHWDGGCRGCDWPGEWGSSGVNQGRCLGGGLPCFQVQCCLFVCCVFITGQQSGVPWAQGGWYRLVPGIELDFSGFTAAVQHTVISSSYSRKPTCGQVTVAALWLECLTTHWMVSVQCSG